MKASLRSVRIAPKKAQLVAKMIRGLRVPDAVELLEHTNKKAARILEDLLRSAIANASHNEQQDPQMMIVKTITVNKAQAFHRGVPMARGRVRPMRKFLSHIDIQLGFEQEEQEKTETKKASEKKKTTTTQKKSTSTSTESSENTSKVAKKPVQKSPTSKAKTASKSTKGKSSEEKKDTATSSSSSATSSTADSPKKSESAS